MADTVEAIGEWFHGPGVARWCQENGVWTPEGQLNRWRNTELVTVYSVDRILTRQGLHVWMLPDTLRRSGPDPDERAPRRKGQEARIGQRGEQKREWDARHKDRRYDECPGCGGLKTKQARKCEICQPGRPKGT